ncbi:uncharacterized protein LOC135688530 [Rhopilema esculentum]|uniref:uncharacterized protein LOC135688530 n=1 Tax=Rhopilema esculentum TaxID=499914 RepID=UPI0031D8DBDE
MICCKELWSIISGRSSLLLPEEISKVLVDNEQRFHNGLAAFKNASEESYLELKKKSPSKGLELVLKLSELLNLDAIQAQELFQSFVRTEFRGTSKQLQTVGAKQFSRRARLASGIILLQGENFSP